jgi:5-methylcytosine-specific restriction endonuclease McrA
MIILCKKTGCNLCFRNLRFRKRSKRYFKICFDCYNAERLRIRSNNRHRRTRRYNAGRIRLADWIEILEIHKFQCADCGKRGRHNLTIDHIIPISEGGSNSANNIQPLCVPCHERKDGYVRRPLWWLRRMLRKWRRFIKKKTGLFLPKIKLLQ